MAVLASGGGEKIAKYMHDFKLSREDAIDEIAADYAMKYLFSDEKTARNVTKHHSKLAQAIIDAIAWIREKLGISSKEVDEAIYRWNKAYNAAREGSKTWAADRKGITNSEGTEYIRFSKVKYINGKPAYESDFADDVSEKERIEIFKKRIGQIFALGAVKLKTDTKKILVEADKFTVKKNLYGSINNKIIIDSLYDLVDILQNANMVGAPQIEDSFVNPKVKPKNAAHKGVKYWYKFSNTVYIDGKEYEFVFNIRDKGKQQFEYLIESHKKKPIGSNVHQSFLTDPAIESNGLYDNSIPDSSEKSNSFSEKSESSSANRSVAGSEMLIDELRSAYSSIDKIYASDKVRKNLTAKAENDLRNGEKALMNVIADAFSIPKENRNILRRAIMQYASKDILSGKEISSESVEKLFDFSLEEFESVGLRVEKCSRDLHHSEFAVGNVMTEYETNFSAQGMPIYFAEVHK